MSRCLEYEVGITCDSWSMEAIGIQWVIYRTCEGISTRRCSSKAINPIPMTTVLWYGILNWLLKKPTLIRRGRFVHWGRRRRVPQKRRQGRNRTFVVHFKVESLFMFYPTWLLRGLNRRLSLVSVNILTLTSIRENCLPIGLVYKTYLESQISIYYSCLSYSPHQITQKLYH